MHPPCPASMYQYALRLKIIASKARNSAAGKCAHRIYLWCLRCFVVISGGASCHRNENISPSHKHTQTDSDRSSRAPSESDFHDDLMRKFRICALNKFSIRENHSEWKVPAGVSRKPPLRLLKCFRLCSAIRVTLFTRIQHPLDKFMCQLFSQ